MKTAVSIPDPLFQRTERLAKRLHRSRSAVYADALADYVARHDPDAITAAYNAVVDSVGDEMKDFRHATLRQAARRLKW